MKIFKYEIPIEEYFSLEFPLNAKILSLQVQHRFPCLWVELDPDEEFVEHKFFIVGTGHEFSKNYTKFIGSFQIEGGRLVYHVYEK